MSIDFNDFTEASAFHDHHHDAADLPSIASSGFGFSFVSYAAVTPFPTDAAVTSSCGSSPPFVQITAMRS